MPSSDLDLPREAGEEAGELVTERVPVAWPAELDLCATSATISLMRRAAGGRAAGGPAAGGRAADGAVSERPLAGRRRDASELERDAKGEVQITNGEAWPGPEVDGEIASPRSSPQREAAQGCAGCAGWGETLRGWRWRC